MRGQRAKGLIEPSKQRDSEVESGEGDTSDDADQTQGYSCHFHLLIGEGIIDVVNDLYALIDGRVRNCQARLWAEEETVGTGYHYHCHMYPQGKSTRVRCFRRSAPPPC